MKKILPILLLSAGCASSQLYQNETGYETRRISPNVLFPGEENMEIVKRQFGTFEGKNGKSECIAETYYGMINNLVVYQKTLSDCKFTDNEGNRTFNEHIIREFIDVDNNTNVDVECVRSKTYQGKDNKITEERICTFGPGFYEKLFP